MSGLGGHINHLYDDLNMTFADIKIIVKNICNGSIEMTEKLDGFNLFMTIRGKDVRVARSQKDIKDGGLSLTDISAKDFQGGPRAKKTFQEAAEVFENAFLDFNKDQINEIFEEGTIYYSFEIVTKDKQNIIQYDSNMIVLHPVGQAKFDQATGKPIQPEYDVSANYQKFIDRLGDLNKISETLPYRFDVAPTIVVDDMDIYNEFDKKINNLMNTFALKDTHKLRDYCKKSLMSNLNRLKSFDVKEDVIELIADILIGKKSTRDIPRGLDDISRDFISKFSKTSVNGKKLLEVSKWPLEKTLHDLSCNIVNKIEDESTEEKDASVAEELQKAIKAIEQYDGEDADKAREILKRNKAKIKNLKDVNTSLEGVVFEFNGALFKLTGDFAPVNQIINLYRYGRGNIPPLNTNIEEGGLPSLVPMQSQLSADPARDVTAMDAAVALFPGAFKPPHAGHFEAVQKLLELKTPTGELRIKEVVIMISPKQRYSDDHKVFVDAELSEEIWRKYIQNVERVTIQVCEKSPVQEVFDYIKTNDYGEENFIVVSSEKDKDDGRFAKLAEYAPNVNITYAITPAFHNINASRMRNVISANDFESFKNYMPVHLSMPEMRDIWSLLKNNSYNKIYQKFQDESENNPVYKELKKRYPNLSENKKFVSDVVIKESMKRFK